MTRIDDQFVPTVNLDNEDVRYYTKFLDHKWESSDIGVTSFRHYFTMLLRTLLEEGEGFSGKRPFGNSGWDWDMVCGVAQIGLTDAWYDREYNEWNIRDYEDATGKVFGLFEAFTQGVGI